MVLNRNCPICDKRNGEKIEHICMNVPENYRLPDSYNIVVCDNCGMVYADTSASVEDYDWYYTNCNFYGDDSKDDNRERYDWMEDLLKKHLTKESVMLELGAGNGRYSMALKEHGYSQITATDPSEESVQRLRAAGIDAYVANIYSEVTEKEQNRYDAVFLFEVTEHLLIPKKGIANVTSLLRNNGYFMLNDPDYSLIAKDTCSIPNYFNLEHINYFSEDSLDTLMAQFHMKRVDQKRIGEDLIQVYQKTTDQIPVRKDEKTKIAVQQYLQQQKERSIQIQKKIGQLQEQEKELVIWGTGSYVMSLLATTALKDCRIVGFVDNNKINMLYSEQIKKQLEAMHTENEIVIL